MAVIGTPPGYNGPPGNNGVGSNGNGSGGRGPGASGGSNAAQRHALMANMSLSQKRAFLANHGFNVDKQGPWSHRFGNAVSAFTAYGTDRAHTWNKNHTVQKPDKHGPSNGGGGGGGGNGGNGGGGAGGAAGAGSGTIPGGLGNLAKGNPNQIGRAMTNLQYQALLDSLNNNMHNLQGQNQQNLADIHSWYGAADKAQGQVNLNDQAEAQATQAHHDATVQSILGALGGDSGAAGQIGQQAIASTQQMDSDAQNQQNFNAQSKANLSQNAALASTNQEHAGDQALQGLKDQLHTALTNKGNSLVTNIASAKQNKLQMLAEIQNMKLAGKGFDLSALQAGDAHNNAILSNKALAQQIKQNAGGADNLNKNWGQLGPQDRQHMEGTVGQAMYDKGGQPTRNPVQAWNFAADALRRANPKWDVKKAPELRHWLASLWSTYISDYNDATGKNFKAKGNGTPWSTW